MEFFPSSLGILYVYIKLENTANKLGFYGKSLFLTHKYLGETGFAEFAEYCFGLKRQKPYISWFPLYSHPFSTQIMEEKGKVRKSGNYYELWSRK